MLAPSPSVSAPCLPHSVSSQSVSLPPISPTKKQKLLCLLLLPVSLSSSLSPTLSPLSSCAPPPPPPPPPPSPQLRNKNSSACSCSLCECLCPASCLPLSISCLSLCGRCPPPPPPHPKPAIWRNKNSSACSLSLCLPPTCLHSLSLWLATTTTLSPVANWVWKKNRRIKTKI